MSDVEQLIHEYRTCAAAHYEPNDGSSGWIQRVNHAADRMITIARHIAGTGPDGITRFATLLDRDDPHVAGWAAHHLLDFMSPDDATRTAALSIIERAAQSNTVESLGEKTWLENWRAEQQDE